MERDAKNTLIFPQIPQIAADYFAWPIRGMGHTKGTAQRAKRPAHTQALCPRLFKYRQENPVIPALVRMPCVPKKNLYTFAPGQIDLSRPGLGRDEESPGSAVYRTS